MPSFKDVYNQRKITDRKDKIGFGKYAAGTVQEILETRPDYFLWLDANTDIEIASDILTEAEENSYGPDDDERWATSRSYDMEDMEDA